MLARLGLCLGLLTAACSSQPELGRWAGPSASVGARTEAWSFADRKGRILISPHYRIHTTIEEEDVLEMLPDVMEGAYQMYREVVPQVPVSQRPLECFIFHWRSEWDSWTQKYAGSDAKTYLQIRSGGYTILDRSVAYYIGRQGTFSVVAHEGWHQFAGRHFKGRLPPFLEEGMACLFETITWKDRLPRWNLSINAPRAQTLRKAMDGNLLYPLEQLCSMHAGDIVGESSEKIDTFYAQSWAFARFLWEGENGRYRPAMQRWLTDTANGTVWDPTRSHARSYAPWLRRAVGPMIEHYLDMDLGEVDRRFQGFMRKVAYEELPAHWRM